MGSSRTPLFVRLGEQHEDECYRAGYSAFLALEDAGVPAATMTLTGRAGLSALLRAFSHDLGMDLLYVAEDEKVFTLEIGDVEAAQKLTVKKPLPCALLPMREKEQTEQRPIKVRQWRTRGQVLPNHLSVEMKERDGSGWEVVGQLPIDSSEWPEAGFLKPGALRRINDDLCRIYVPWWKPLPHVDSVAVRSAPVHFVIFLDAFFHDAELKLPFNDADALAARFEEQDVDFSSFWPLVQLYGLRIQLNTAGLATRIEEARLDNHSFARLAKRVSPHVLQSMLFCARALESANRDSKVSQACTSWAEREYDLEPTSREPLGVWTRRTIFWVVYLLKAPVVDDYLEKAKERERVALAHDPHSAPSSPELDRAPHAHSYHDTPRDSRHPHPDDLGPKRSRSKRQPKGTHPLRSSHHKTRPPPDDGDELTLSDIEEIERRPREAERAPKYSRASDWDDVSPPPVPRHNHYSSFGDFTEGREPPAALRRNSTFSSGRGGDGRRGSASRYLPDDEQYYLSPSEEPIPPLSSRKKKAPARASTKDPWAADEYDYRRTSGHARASPPPHHDSHAYAEDSSFTDDDAADDYIKPPPSSSRPLSSRALSSRPLSRPKYYDDGDDYILPPSSSSSKPLSKPKHKSKPSQSYYDDPINSTRRRH
uniref:BY PROTMAP: gi/647401049/emb/CDR46992.1/ RHTO0S13e04500g1_1 [Rhodosporidium toruloides] n=1 Tax=Rhodotorula toruloides TaxID=5286 RepID=A0A0K3CPK9_RHOTO